MNTDKIKIGYAIANDSLDIPAYRRRFGYYLKKRNYYWEVANIKNVYDLIVVHHSADLTAWQQYDKAKVVFDYNDDYLSTSSLDIKGLGRGVAKFIFKQWSKIELDFRKAYISMMKRADAIVCCTDAQETQAKQYCANVHQILDLQSDADWVNKKNYVAGETFNIVWEGLPSFDGLKALVPVLRKFQKKHKCAIHIITAIKHGMYLRDIIKVHTKDEIENKIRLKEIYIYEWNQYLFSHIATACDLAIIPIDMRQPFWVAKPANKLLFFWRMAMPTLVDPTPAYEKLMTECGLDMVCNSPSEWEEKLERFYLNQDERRVAGTKAKTFVDANYNEELLLAKWDRVLTSII